MNKGLSYYIEYAIYYSIIFFILRQWLIPIMELTGTGRYELFLVFIAISLFLYLIHVPAIVTWLIKIAFIVWFMMHVYSGYSPFTAQALSFVVEELRYNMSTLIQMEWSHVSDSFRSMLFFILIWMLIYLIHHWIHVRSTIFYFFLLTVFFIGALDTFSPYDGKRAIIEIVVLGLIMTSMLFIKRLVKRTDRILDMKQSILYVLPTVVLVGAFSFLAYHMPKAAPQWPDPVPFIQNMSGKGGGTGIGSYVASVGYSLDDTKLGGPFRPDDKHVYTVQSKTKQYWRIEAREIYTSRGWESYRDDLFVDYEFGQDIFFTANRSSTDSEELTAIITPKANYPVLLYPYGTTKFTTNVESQAPLRHQQITDRVDVLDEVKTGPYTAHYSEVEYSYTALKASNVQEVPGSAYYLQLPDTLPARVRNLAFEITATQTSAYDKARAIQSYFSRSGFVYRTEDVPVPAADQDYVDQFLFETKYGYCDNYSTAMVVMLRSIGIPARWVKGFTGGTETTSDNPAYREFEITNNNAHSWVEAYIGGVGWMPFEPTPGYTSPADISYDLVATEETDPALLEEQEQQLLEQQEEQAIEEDATTPAVEETKPNAVKSSISRILSIIVIVLLVIALILYVQRRKWLPKVYVQMQKNVEMDESSFEKSYERLLRQLGNVGLPRTKGQTLQAYAKVVDSYYETTHMKVLTDAYEEIIYSRTANEIDFIKMKESWEYLINRTTG